jgi:hypothetical protein
MNWHIGYRLKFLLPEGYFDSVVELVDVLVGPGFVDEMGVFFVVC